jgi:hypothetical protein
MTSYNDQILPAYEAYREGDVAAAADISSAVYDEHRESNSKVIFALDNGTMLRDAGYYRQAFDVLEQAEATLKIGYDQRSLLSGAAMTESVASILVNQKSLAYIGTISDRVLLNTYKALAALEMGELDHALVEARRIDQAQQQAEELFREEYEAMKAEAKEKGYELDIDGLYRQEGFVKHNRDLFKDAGVDDFSNPFATFVIGMLRRIAPDNGEDPTYDFNWLHQRLPNNVYIKHELDAIRNRESVDGTVFVIFENGRGPFLVEELVAIPTGVFRVYAGQDIAGNWYDKDYLALPKFMPGRRAANALQIIAGPTNRSTTSVIADMNQIARYEFNARYPGILMREVISAAVKGIGFGIVQGVAKEMMSSDDDGGALFGALLSIGSSITKNAMAQADDRAWKTIACNYQIARFKRGESNTLRLNLVGGNAQTTVEIPDAAAVVVIVRSVNSSHINARAYGFGNTTIK